MSGAITCGTSRCDTYKGNYGPLADMNMDSVRSKGTWKILMKRVQRFALLAEINYVKRRRRANFN